VPATPAKMRLASYWMEVLVDESKVVNERRFMGEEEYRLSEMPLGQTLVREVVP